MKRLFVIFVVLLLTSTVSFSQGQKISDMPDASSLSGAEVVPVVQSGANRKVSFSTLLTWVKSQFTKSDVGLGNVDNTSDANKPVSTAQQTAINGKQDVDSDLTAIAGLSPSNDDIIQRKAGAWTNRTVAQYKTDLALTKSDVGLGSVDNTADASKPVSTAQQTAINAKVADAINDGTTTVAPSQNAVFDADALKIDKLITANRQTSSYTLVIGDAVKLVEINNASANNLTVPPNSSVAFPIGTQIMIAQYGAGQTTIVAGVGVTLRSDGSKLKIAAQYSAATILKIATDEWYVFGNLTN